MQEAASDRSVAEDQARTTVKTNCRVLPAYELPAGKVLQEWLAQEREYWEGFSSIQPNGRAAWKRISPAIQSLINDATSRSFAPGIYTPTGGSALIPSESYVGQAIRHAKSISAEIAAAMLAALVDASVDIGSPAAVRGIVWAVLLESGLNDEVSAGFARRIAEAESSAARAKHLAESTRSELEGLRDAHRAALGDHETRVEKLCTDLEGKLKEALDSVTATQQEYEHVVQSQGKSADAQIRAAAGKAEAQLAAIRDEHSEALKVLERVYEEKLALRAPTKYWRTRRRLHAAAAKRWGTRFRTGLLTTVLLILLLYLYSEWNYGDEMPPAWHFGAGITLLVLALWALRVLARLLWSNYNLANDAAQKETFVQSYLALLQKQDGRMESQERAIALTEVFRPASDGYVNDDAFPWGQIERLIKR